MLLRVRVSMSEGLPWLTYPAKVGTTIMSVLLSLSSVRGIGKAFQGIPFGERQGLLEVLLAYLRRSSDVINGPGRSQAGRKLLSTPAY